MIRPLDDRFEAIYFDGRTAARHPAVVELLEPSIKVTVESGEPEIWPYEEIRLACDGSYGEPARLERSRDFAESLVVAREDFAASLAQRRPALVQRPWWDPRLEGWSGILTACSIVAGLSALMYWWGVPLLADTAARFAPRGAEERLGQSVVNMLAPARVRISDPDREMVLNKITRRLVAASGSEYQFKVIYARLGMVNAFAVPGGTIVVSDSLLRVTRTPDEFAGVLAHEIQHVIHKHSTRALARELGARAILSMMAVDSAGTPLAATGMSELVNLDYRRADEDQADMEGVRLLIKAGINADGLAAFLERLNSKDGGLGRYLSTHPVTQERIAKVRSLSKNAPAGAPPLTDMEWQAARMVGLGTMK